MFIPQEYPYSPAFCGVISTETFTFKGRWRFIRKSGKTTSSKQLLWSRRKKLILVVSPTGKTTRSGEYPPSTTISISLPTTTSRPFFPKKNHQVKIPNKKPLKTTTISSILIKNPKNYFLPICFQSQMPKSTRSTNKTKYKKSPKEPAAPIIFP